MLLAQPVDELGAQDVDLAVEDAPAIGHLLLLVRELLDEVLELLVGERTEIGEGVHLKASPLLRATRRNGKHSVHQAQLEPCARACRRPSRTYCTVAPSTSANPMYSSVSASQSTPHSAKKSALNTGQTPQRPSQLIFRSTCRAIA